MNKREKAKFQKLQVIWEAHRRGEVIQEKRISDGRWYDGGFPDIYSDLRNFRIKPEFKPKIKISSKKKFYVLASYNLATSNKKIADMWIRKGFFPHICNEGC